MTTNSTNRPDSAWIVPDWPAPARVRALLTTRSGGVSPAPYASLNLGDHVGDEARNVAENRARVAACLPAAPRWLNQVHGTTVLELGLDAVSQLPPEADAALARESGQVCAVMTADCLPGLSGQGGVGLRRQLRYGIKTEFCLLYTSPSPRD